MEEEEYDQTLYDLSKEIQLKAIEMQKDIKTVMKFFSKMAKFFSEQALSIKRKRTVIPSSSKRSRRKHQKKEEEYYTEEEDDNNQEEEDEYQEKDVKEEKILQPSQKKKQQIQHEFQLQLGPQHERYQPTLTRSEYKRKKNEEPKISETIIEMVGVRNNVKYKRFKIIMVINGIEAELGPFSSRLLAKQLRTRLRFQLKSSSLRIHSTKEEILDIFNRIRDEIYDKYPPFKVSKRGSGLARKTTENSSYQNEDILEYLEEESENPDQEDEKDDDNKNN